jgi:hypothetical protein
VNLEIPTALKHDHDEMRATLNRASQESGAIGKAGAYAARIVFPHIAREEKIAFPVLGLLPEIISGRTSAEMTGALALINQFRASLDVLHSEHDRIRSAGQTLLTAATNEGHGEYTQFVYRLMVHESVEEQVIYSSVLLIGEYLREKLKH